MDHSPSRAGGDAGFALLEAVVSAALLAIVALAILSGIDGSSRSAARERSRSVAATLAEQDQERMRAMSADSLTDYNPAPVVKTVDKVNYKVTSTSEWITDETGGTTSCTNNGKQVNYLKISSTVESTIIGKQTKPVTLTSLVAPPVSKAEGTLAVQVNNRDNNGVEGIVVTAKAKSTGTTYGPEKTNAVGCAIFLNLPVDTYTVFISDTTGVDGFGNNPGQKGVDVLNGTVQVVNMRWDQAAWVDWSVQTFNPWSTAIGGVSSKATITNSTVQGVSTVNGDEPTLFRTFGTSPKRAQPLFPFKSQYSFFAGTCDQENPAQMVDSPIADYFTGHIGAVATNPNLGSIVTMFQPPVGLRFKTSTGYLSNSNVVVKASLVPRPGDTTPCSETDTLSIYKNGTNDGYLSQSSSAYDPGMAFGTWDVCARTGTSPSKKYWYGRIYNTDTNGQVLADATLTSGGLPAVWPPDDNGNAVCG
jgi:type II secretory pathway pseudopilin PulG